MIKVKNQGSRVWGSSISKPRRGWGRQEAHTVQAKRATRDEVLPVSLGTHHRLP